MTRRLLALAFLASAAWASAEPVTLKPVWTPGEVVTTTSVVTGSSSGVTIVFTVVTEDAAKKVTEDGTVELARTIKSIKFDAMGPGQEQGPTPPQMVLLDAAGGPKTGYDPLVGWTLFAAYAGKTELTLGEATLFEFKSDAVVCMGQFTLEMVEAGVGAYRTSYTIEVPRASQMGMTVELTGTVDMKAGRLIEATGTASGAMFSLGSPGSKSNVTIKTEVK